MYTMDEYQKQAHSTALYEEGINSFSHAQLLYLAKLSYCIHGLCGESGESAEKIKKFYRGGQPGTEADWEAFTQSLSKEIGDALWYVSEIAYMLDLQLDTVARQNLEKLFDRQKRGVLHGSGDQR